MRIILASASPRRRELLEQIGLSFEVMTSHVEEKISSSEPDRVVEELSRGKAKAVAEEPVRDREAAAEGALLVIGADTVVALDGAILGKPADAEDAFRMLERLQGREHEVYTGVTLLYRAAGASGWTVRSFHERTCVHFYPMTEAEISEYVDTGDPLDKAGAYGIQGFCARYVRGIEGDYNNVVGLPVGRLYQEIKELSES
ncbi:MAG: Maf family protein [Acetatifactor sp.]|nr:Maf family protein [Acetatifactor sp.]